MKAKLSFAWFWVTYQANNLVTKFSNKKDRKYLIVISGRYPSNMNTVLRSVVSKGTTLRYSMSPHTIYLMFESTYDFKYIDNHLKDCLTGYVDNFVVIQMNKFARRFYSLNMSPNTFANLYGRLTPAERSVNLNDKLDVMQMVMDTLQRARTRMENFAQEVAREVEAYTKENGLNENFEYEQPKVNLEKELTPEEAESQINAILQKINEFGIESLTENEKHTLQKYGNL